MTAAPALAEECRIGPADDPKGPAVFLDYDQAQLDASYTQIDYEPNLRADCRQRLASNSDAARQRIGQPQRVAYGPSEVEQLDIYRTKRAHAPIFVFIHGGAWLGGAAKDAFYAAEQFVNAGAHFVALDFIAVKAAGGDIGDDGPAGACAIAWTYKNRPTPSAATRIGSLSAAIRRAGYCAAWRSSPIGRRISACTATASAAGCA